MMETKEMQKKATGVVFGLLLVGVGALFALDNMEVLEAGRLASYWPLFLIGFGLPSLIAPKEPADPVWGVVLCALGTFFLLRNLDVIELSYWDLWPVILVLAGATLLVRSLAGRRDGRGSGVASAQNGGAR